MKKVLFATTALVASAGFASADVALSGSAQMGVGYQDATGLVLADDGTTTADLVADTGEGTTQFYQDIDVTFTLSGETDGGLTFGAAVDLDENAGGVGTDDAGVAIFISGDFGTVTMGDTDGGFDAGMVEVPAGPGSINDDETAHAGWNGNAGLDGSFDGQILSYSYSVSGFTITGSVELDDSGTYDPIYGIGAQYTGSFGGGSYTIGAGYQVANDGFTGNTFTAAVSATNPAADTITYMFTDASIAGISAQVALDSGLTAGITYSMFTGTADTSSSVDGAAATVTETGVAYDETHFGIGVAYDFGDFSVGANYGAYDNDVNVFDREGFGISAGYDLGGGLSVNLGYGSSEQAGNTDNTWSFGALMSF